MDWKTLMSEERYTANTYVRRSVARQIVSDFQLDAEKIIYTSVFRRLQGKTQVYPFPAYDYLRTRLTHTNEVAFVGKILGRGIGRRLSASERGNIDPEDISDVVYAACLAHDLGNPPFGHIGEEAIKTWFLREKTKPGSPFNSTLSDAHTMYDFLHFDGNAQGFRIMTRLSSWREEGGMRLTYAVAGAFSKYPFPSETSSPDKQKFGYMADDSDAARKIFTALGMNNADGTYSRHPLAFLVEAADDISYLTTDVDDAHRVKQLKFDDSQALLLKIVDMGNYADEYNAYKCNNEQDKISFLRSLASATLIEGAATAFLDNRSTILSGRFKEPLIKVSKFAGAATEIRTACEERVYLEKNKIQLEAAGFNVIIGLLDLFGTMIEDYIAKKGSVKDMNHKSRNLYSLMPEENRKRMVATDPYKCMVVLVDYVSGMTDRFALDLFQRLSGHSPALGKMA
ncbi:dGTP triphosphohydrolase [Bradyrhizobium sp. AC87j1]|uniref:dGTP triphosphohydrolase n=1 Tax=Bradyrhizobium sp. AC87j1 TaxID=2055894 RepID=UPI001374DDFA|nr:dNTP triphosphohydrolase [Bradyrhizobium sp. AC87j1]